MTETRRAPPRLLLDEHVVAALAPALRERGVDAVHVLEEGLGGAPDPTPFRWCQARRRRGEAKVAGTFAWLDRAP